MAAQARGEMEDKETVTSEQAGEQGAAFSGSEDALKWVGLAVEILKP